MCGGCTDIPAAALSPLLGIGIETAVRWTHWAKRDWQAYIEARAKSSAAPNRDRNGAIDAPAIEQGRASGRPRHQLVVMPPGDDRTRLRAVFV
jgi:hypothetical protein